MATSGFWFIILSIFSIPAFAQNSCQAYGVDYSNGGTYNIDQGSNEYFTFTSLFQGCYQESINPVLVSPEGNQYACSTISTTPSNQQVQSRCGIPFSAMTSGDWKIVLQGNQISVQRVIHLRVGQPEVVVVTATPTVIIGITSTPSAITVRSTIVQTQTLILAPSTTTQNCNTGTQTVTSYIATNPTSRVTSTLTRTQTDGQKTSFWTTTMTTTAMCHYPTNNKRELIARDSAADAAVAATTVTVTETTYTVTQTQVSTVPASTTTEVYPIYVTTTVTPPPKTICDGQARPTNTVTVYSGIGGDPVTLTNIVTTTTHLSGTVWVGQTQYTTVSNTASASACWRAGGWYGR